MFFQIIKVPNLLRTIILNIIIDGGIIMKSSKKQKILAVMLAASLVAGDNTLPITAFVISFKKKHS